MNKVSEPKSFLKWAGSKRKLLPILVQYWKKSSQKRYIEPFVGSAQLYFKINPNNAIINDINTELINTYRVVQKQPELLSELLTTYERSKDFYYHLRSIDLSTLNNIEKAARFIYLNKLCFNGLYRTNLKGEFNVPYSASSTGKFPTLDELLECSKSLTNVILCNDDFETLLRQYVEQDDFVYLDPPYAVANKKIFHQYDPRTFGLEDLNRLKSLLIDLDNKNVSFLLSYAHCDEFISLFSDWKMESVLTQRNIAGFSKNRRVEKEILISNL